MSSLTVTQCAPCAMFAWEIWRLRNWHKSFSKSQWHVCCWSLLCVCVCVCVRQRERERERTREGESERGEIYLLVPGSCNVRLVRNLSAAVATTKLQKRTVKEVFWTKLLGITIWGDSINNQRTVKWPLAPKTSPIQTFKDVILPHSASCCPQHCPERFSSFL